MPTDKQHRIFLNTKVFAGLRNINTGFDAPTIKYFSPYDFEIVLLRIKELGLGVTGIEPWRNGDFFDVETYEAYTDDPTDACWYFKVFEGFRKIAGDLQYSATYYIPENLLIGVE